MRRIKSQAVAAFGERSVEAELLRRGWITSNANSTVNNVADFDLFALKEGRTVHVRVKTCSPDQDPQFPLRLTREADVSQFDFTVVVRMGADRATDSFYVVPTSIVREAVRTHWSTYMAQPKRDGGPHRETANWTLHWASRKTGEDAPNDGFEVKWAQYLNAWDWLDANA